MACFNGGNDDADLQKKKKRKQACTWTGADVEKKKSVVDMLLSAPGIVKPPAQQS